MPLAACLSLAAAMAVALGLTPGELVVRGGHLLAPRVFTGVETINDRMYFPLRKTDHNMAALLCPGPLRGRPLANSDVFEKMIACRKKKYGELIEALAVPDEPEEPDLADAMGLDAPEEPAKRLRAPTRSNNKALKAQLPAVVEIEPPPARMGRSESRRSSWRTR